MIPLPSARWVDLFARYSRRYLARHFHAVRLARAGRAPEIDPGRPLVVYLNHPAWWDPLLGLLLARRCFSRRQPYAPIEARALGRYQFFARLGFFGVEPGTAAGARRFLAASQEILARPGTALWVTPGGRFADPRERPVVLRPGLGHLARRVPGAVFLPLAVEYPFWEERFPEALAAFGEPLPIAGSREAEEWTALLAARLEAAQDALAREALARDAGRFDTLLGGSAGVGGVYDLWRGLKARLRGERFVRSHGEE